MTVPNYFTWYPPQGGGPLVWGDRPYVLRHFSQLGNTLTLPQATKGPFQVGESFLNVDIGARILTITLRLIATDLAELNTLRSALTRSMAMEPTISLDAPSLGVLRWVREGHDTLELLCAPRESPQFGEIPGSTAVDADIELYAPDPYWRELNQHSVVLLGVGGFEWPLELPIEMESFSIEAEIENGGDVSTPIRAQVFGEIETFRLINDTTGEELEVQGPILADEYIEVNTAYGQKSLIYVDSLGNRTSVMSRLTLGSTFWHARRGVNVVRYEADVNVSGRVAFFWRERFAGV
jgi:hypothetical protein